MDGERVTQIARDRAFGHYGMYDRGLAYIFAQIGGDGFDSANALLMGKMKLDVDEEGAPVFEEDDWEPPKREWDMLIDDVDKVIQELNNYNIENNIESFIVELQITHLNAIRDEAVMQESIAIAHFKQYLDVIDKFQ